MSDKKMRIAAVVYPVSEGAHADTVISDVARRLKSDGMRIAGAVQHNTYNGDRCRCDMTLEDLSSGRLVQISEDRGVWKPLIASGGMDQVLGRRFYWLNQLSESTFNGRTERIKSAADQ